MNAGTFGFVYEITDGGTKIVGENVGTGDFSLQILFAGSCSTL